MRLFRFVPLILALALTQGLHAQQDETDEEAAQADETVMEEEVMDEIVVTGSRIRRDEFSSAAPVQIIDGQVSRELG